MNRLILIFAGINLFQFNYSQYKTLDAKHLLEVQQDLLIKNYYTKISHDKDYIAGESYNFYTGSKNLPFLFSNWQEGKIYCEGIWYNLKNMMFDIYSDAVIISESYNGTKQIISMNKSLVKEFMIQDRNFLFIDNKALNNQKIVSGYYEILYDGNYKLYKKISCYYSKSNNLEKGEFVINSNYYFFNLSGEMVLIKNKSALIKILNDKEKEIKKHIRDKKLNFFDDKENSFIELVKFYDVLDNIKK